MNEQTREKLDFFAKALLYLLAFGLCLKGLREADLWWMQHTGQYILEQGGLPDTDPFSYTFANKQWINVKWLYEVLLAFLHKLGGLEMAFVWQGFISVATLVVLGRSGKLLLGREKTSAVSLLLLLFAAWVLEFRWIGRPEMHSHFFAVLYFYLFWLYTKGQISKGIFVLIPLQILWTNMHEAFATGLVMLTAFAAAYSVEYWFRRKAESPLPSPKHLLIASALAGLSIGIHPWHIHMYSYPFEVFGQLSSNQYTQELFSYKRSEYWTWQAYSSMAFALLSIAALVSICWQGRKESKPWYLALSEQFSWAQLVLLALFFYLGLTAQRNIPFFVLASLPLLFYFFERLVGIWKKTSLGLFVLASVFSYWGLVSDSLRKSYDSPDRFGLQVMASYNPEGAALFIGEQGLASKRNMSDYLVSSYMLSNLAPEFKSYIDFRDLDIFSDAFFQQFLQMNIDQSLFEKEDSLWNFDYVLLLRSRFAPLHKYLWDSESYELVFADPVAAVYLKNKAEHKELIEKYSFRKRGVEAFSKFGANSTTALGRLLTKIYYPLFEADDNSSVSQELLAASFYSSLGEEQWAIDYAQRAIRTEQGEWKLRAHSFLGDVYNNLALDMSLGDSLQGLYRQASAEQYTAALALDAKDLDANLGLAVWYFRQEAFGDALQILKKNLEQHPTSPRIHDMLANCYKFLANTDPNPSVPLGKQLEHLKHLERSQGQDPFLRFELALVYCRLNNCKASRPLLEELQNFPGLSPDERGLLQQCFARCGG